MVEIVQKMEHHSLAYARLDIPVNSAKYQVSAILKNVLDLFFARSHSYSKNNFVETSFI